MINIHYIDELYSYNIPPPSQLIIHTKTALDLSKDVNVCNLKSQLSTIFVNKWIWYKMSKNNILLALFYSFESRVKIIHDLVLSNKFIDY